MTLARDALTEFFRKKMGVDVSSLTDDSPLFSSGLVDSFGMVELITFLEAAAGIRIDAMDVAMENIDTLRSILAFVEEKSPR